MTNLQFLVTGSVTTVKTNVGSLVGYLVAREDGSVTTICGPGHGTGATYTTQHRALENLLAGTSPTRSERQADSV